MTFSRADADPPSACLRDLWEEAPPVHLQLVATKFSGKYAKTAPLPGFKFAKY